MATNWSYVPLIGEPVRLTNDAGDPIPRLVVPGLQGPPRANKLKIYFSILNVVSTAAPDDKIRVTTRFPRALTANEAAFNLNAFLPILTMTKGAFGSTQNWHSVGSTLLAGNSLLEALLEMTGPPLPAAQLILCIDYSHSVVD